MIRLDWDRSAFPMPRSLGFYTVHVDPEPGWPLGRKGLQITAAWETLAGAETAGLVTLDGDVAIDPQDLAAMLAAVEQHPADVLIAPVRLWPASTKMERWIWGHGKGGFSRNDPDDPDMFGFSFTYLPARLVTTMIAQGLADVTYPSVDATARRIARELKLRCRVVREASPKHMNW
jgi:hypothetical protein